MITTKSKFIYDSNTSTGFVSAIDKYIFGLYRCFYDSSRDVFSHIISIEKQYNTINNYYDFSMNKDINDLMTFSKEILIPIRYYMTIAYILTFINIFTVINLLPIWYTYGLFSWFVFSLLIFDLMVLNVILILVYICKTLSNQTRPIRKIVKKYIIPNGVKNDKIIQRTIKI